MNKIYDGKLRVLELCTSFFEWTFFNEMKLLPQAKEVIDKTHPCIEHSCFFIWKIHTHFNLHKLPLDAKDVKRTS